MTAPAVDIVAASGGARTYLAREFPDSIVDRAYMRFSGTSASAAVVSGAVALMLGLTLLFEGEFQLLLGPLLDPDVLGEHDRVPRPVLRIEQPHAASPAPDRLAVLANVAFLQLHHASPPGDVA